MIPRESSNSHFLDHILVTTFKAFNELAASSTMHATQVIRPSDSSLVFLDEADFFSNPEQLQRTLERPPDTREILEHPERDLLLPGKREQIILRAPSIRLLAMLRDADISLHDLSWRQFEEIVAELLRQDGYEVILGPGSKDGGKDIMARKRVSGSGLFMAVWQAKKLASHNKVGLSVIRELADTRQVHKASKGVIVTTTSLTRGALARIEQEQYLLHKVDDNDLEAWIQTGQQP